MSTTIVQVMRGAMVTLTEMRDAIRMLGVRGWFLAALGGLGTLLLIGIAAAVFDNPFFARPLEVRSQDYVLWGATAVLAGLIIGTYARPLPATDGGGGKAVTGGFLSFVAVSCPICNKVAVTLLGTSGALTFFGPTQLYIGIASLLLLAWSLRLRARTIVGSCAIDLAPQPISASHQDR